MADELRPEYDLSKLKGGVRGKYARRFAERQEMKTLLCNVCWMKRYAGISKEDIPRHGGYHILKHGYGHEAINFKPHG